MKFWNKIAKYLLKRLKMLQIKSEYRKVDKTIFKDKNRLYGRYNENYRQRLTFHRKIID